MTGLSVSGMVSQCPAAMRFRAMAMECIKCVWRRKSNMETRVMRAERMRLSRVLRLIQPEIWAMLPLFPIVLKHQKESRLVAKINRA